MPADYERIERAIHYLERNVHEQPSLRDVAKHIGLSDYYFQRLFRRFAGVTPKRFLQFLTAEYAKTLLCESRSVLDAAYGTGLSGPGRLHDLMVKIHGVTPGELKKQGMGLTIRYGFHDSPFGECLLAVTHRGICRFTFVLPGDGERKMKHLKRQWPKAALKEDSKATLPIIEQIFYPSGKRVDPKLMLYVKGTNFQIKVWEALLRVPLGAVITYSDLAERTGYLGAARAVGTAVGHNPVSYLIPCHRVIRKTGAFGEYGGGAARKKVILGWESARFRS